MRTSSKSRAPHLVAAVPEAPRQTLDLLTAGDTPILREHRAVKTEFPDAIVLSRLGDFFEMFGPDGGGDRDAVAAEGERLLEFAAPGSPDAELRFGPIT